MKHRGIRIATQTDARALIDRCLAVEEAGRSVVDAYRAMRAAGSFSGFWTHIDDLAKALPAVATPAVDDSDLHWYSPPDAQGALPPSHPVAAPSASSCDAREIGEDACTCRRCLMGQVERLRAAVVAVWNTANTNDDSPKGCYFVRSEQMLAAHALTHAPGRNCPAAPKPCAHSTGESGRCVYCGARYPTIAPVGEGEA